MYEGSGSYLGFGYDLAPGIPGPITAFMEFQSESISPKWTKKAPPNINPRRATQRGRLLQVLIAGTVKGAPDAESQARLRANHQGKVVTTSPEAGVYQHVLSQLMPIDAPEAVYRKTLSGIVYRDDNAPQFVMGGVVSKVDISVKDGEYVDMSHDLMFGNVTESGPPVAAVANNAAWDGTLHVRGLRRDPTATTPVYVRCFTGGLLDGTAKVKMKIGGAAVGEGTFIAEFTGPDIAVVQEQWLDGVDDVLTPIGPSFTNPYQICFHDAADTDDVLTIGDTWTIAAKITVVAPTYSARSVYDYGQMVALVGGKQYIWKDAAISMTKPRTDNRGLGSYFSQGFTDNGEMACSITLNRNMVDRDFLNALQIDADSAFKATFTGNRIAATAHRDSHEILVSGVQYDDAGTQIANAGQNPEKVVLTGYDDGTHPIFQETLVNTIAVI